MRTYEKSKHVSLLCQYYVVIYLPLANTQGGSLCFVSCISITLPCSGSPTPEAEAPASVRTPFFNEPHQVTSKAQQRPDGSQLSLHDLCVTPYGAGMIIEFNLQFRII